jgi:hypothetical protein
MYYMTGINRFASFLVSSRNIRINLRVLKAAKSYGEEISGVLTLANRRYWW